MDKSVEPRRGSSQDAMSDTTDDISTPTAGIGHGRAAETESQAAGGASIDIRYDPKRAMDMANVMGQTWLAIGRELTDFTLSRWDGDLSDLMATGSGTPSERFVRQSDMILARQEALLQEWCAISTLWLDGLRRCWRTDEEPFSASDRRAGNGGVH